MKEYLKIIRPLNCLMTFVAVFVGVLVSGFSSFQPVILAGISAFFICGGGMVINDYIDRELDKMDKPERSIPSGKISPNCALIYSIILFVLGGLISWFVNYQVFLVGIIAIIVLTLYSKYFQRMFLVGNLIVSLMVGLSFIYGGLVSGNPLPTFLMALIAFFFNTGRELIKDVEDAESDSENGIRSVAIVLGEWGGKILAIIFVLFGIIVTPIPYLINIFGNFYLSLAIIADIIFVCTIVMILKNGKDNKIQRLM
ncbi:MAG: UbiA family prenyltransferase, partial [Candidatus Aenigmatarchaeota archaeon]